MNYIYYNTDMQQITIVKFKPITDKSSLREIFTAMQMVDNFPTRS